MRPRRWSFCACHLATSSKLLAHAAAQVLGGVVGVDHIEALGGVGDRLHQAHGGFGRLGTGLEVGLDGNILTIQTYGESYGFLLAFIHDLSEI